MRNGGHPLVNEPWAVADILMAWVSGTVAGIMLDRLVLRPLVDARNRARRNGR